MNQTPNTPLELYPDESELKPEQYPVIPDEDIQLAIRILSRLSKPARAAGQHETMEAGNGHAE